MADTAHANPFSARWSLPDGNRLARFLLVAVALVVGLAILQDFLQAMRRGGAFYWSESLLFKTVWFTFPPVLLLLARQIETGRSATLAGKALLVALATLAHLALVPPTVWLMSALFLDHHYEALKVFTYTLSNDLLAILLVYTAFVGLAKVPARAAADERPAPRHLVVNSGRKYQRVALDEILTVTSATPYVAIKIGETEHLHLATMASIGKQLGPRFVRVHRSARVNIDKVAGLTSRLNGDYDLTLVDGSQVRLSRHYAAAFKARFGAGPRLTP